MQAPLRFASVVARRGLRTFFNDGFADNTSMETVYRALVKTPAVSEKLMDFYAANMDVDSLSGMKGTNNVCVALPPYLGDPHRVLLAYSLLRNENKSITEADGCPIVEIMMGEEPQRIKIVDHDLISFLAKQLLTKLGQDSSMDGAQAYLDSLMDGAEAEAQKLSQKTGQVQSPLELAIEQQYAESAPKLSNFQQSAGELEALKHATEVNPSSGKVEGKFKYFI
eukprot:NODE_7023_length_799_cov_84.943787_g6785_i0.p1 GENE.NODE_7023_length_799_cov_84.943787_g6785_i0~~NODE_7023_length_799_cov_84.943787_g6785_i0.p1  ORF type:complete len:247 (-),score=77.49 NODE_7023_length_799_cov_84.943787_g6785_i0:58-729(-)